MSRFISLLFIIAFFSLGAQAQNNTSLNSVLSSALGCLTPCTSIVTYATGTCSSQYAAVSLLNTSSIDSNTQTLTNFISCECPALSAASSSCVSCVNAVFPLFNQIIHDCNTSNYSDILSIIKSVGSGFGNKTASAPTSTPKLNSAMTQSSFTIGLAMIMTIVLFYE